MPDVDPLLPKRLRDNAAVRAGEARVYAATTRALDALAREIRSACADAHYAPTDTRSWPGWEAAVEAQILPALTRVYVGSYDDPRSIVAAASVNARQNATRYMRLIYNRLVRAADEVWAAVQAVLAAGVERHEAIPDIARRVDAALAEQGAERWRGRATTIARTETIAAFNNGRLDGGKALAAEVGVAERDVFKSWLATRTDNRTRATHRAADRQTVPVNATFTVGGARGAAPGDPMLPASECVNCRCTVLVLLPGDRGYPEHHTPSPMSLAASGVLTFDFHPDQKRGPDGRFIKFLTQRDAFKSFQVPDGWGARDDEDHTISQGPEFRKWMRDGRPQDHPNGLALANVWARQEIRRRGQKPTTENVLAWYRPSRFKDKDFPDNPKVGDVIQDQAPLATETQKPTHVKPKVLYAVRIPAGSEGVLPVRDGSKYAYYEGAQIPPGAKLQVSDVREENGQRLITVDLLPADVEPTPVVPKPEPLPEPVPEPAPTPDVPKVGDRVSGGSTGTANDLPLGSRVKTYAGGLWERTDKGWTRDGSSITIKVISGGEVLRVGYDGADPSPGPAPTPDPAPDIPTPVAPKVGDSITSAEMRRSLPIGTRASFPNNDEEWEKVGEDEWKSTQYGSVVPGSALDYPGRPLQIKRLGADDGTRARVVNDKGIPDGYPDFGRATVEVPASRGRRDPRIGTRVGKYDATKLPDFAKVKADDGTVYTVTPPIDGRRLGDPPDLFNDATGERVSVFSISGDAVTITEIPAPQWHSRPKRGTRSASASAADASLTKRMPTGNGYDPILDWSEMPEAGRPMSAEEARAGANPFNRSRRGLDDGERRKARTAVDAAVPGSETEFGINCQRVAATFELRRRGYDVTAGAGSGGSMNSSEVWADADGNTRQPESFTSLAQMQKRVARDGPGARYVVWGAWKAGGAHIFNAENVDGSLQAYESQVEGYQDRGANSHFDRLSWRGKGGYSGVSILRVDDLTPHPSLFERGYIVSSPAVAAVPEAVAPEVAG